jgi:hypothetical protein
LIKNIVKACAPAIDLLLAPFVAASGWLLLMTRRLGLARLPVSKRILLSIGVYPLRDHYYEPLFDTRHLRYPLGEVRSLPGIDLDEPCQLRLVEDLARAGYAAELQDLPSGPTGRVEFHFNNGAFESGDAEFWYAVVRHFKPKRIIEIGSGNSTLMARRAVVRNRADDPAYQCRHTCVEPYEMDWLERCEVEVIRRRVEELDPSFFAVLEENDILFIDSSHMIRPQGDVLFEFLQVLPLLRPGVIVHVHDIFTPRDYLAKWVETETKFWNEQYLLEAFLGHNRDWQVLAALNFLQHGHPERLRRVCPYLDDSREPGSFYLQRRLASDPAPNQSDTHQGNALT